MSRKPAEVVRAIKEKVARVKLTKAKPLADSPPAAEAPEPQRDAWVCSICGNVATGPVCPVDGAKESKHE